MAVFSLFLGVMGKLFDFTDTGKAIGSAFSTLGPWVFFILGVVILMWVHVWPRLANRLSSYSTKDRLTQLYGLGLDLNNTWESGHPAGPERWRTEVERWVSKVEDELRKLYGDETAAKFKLMPMPEIEPNTGPSYVAERQREKLMILRLSMLSDLLQ